MWFDDVNDAADMTLASPTYYPASGSAHLSFQHGYTLWAPDAGTRYNGAFNGAVLEISLNVRAFQDILAAGGSFAAGGYNAALDPNYDNPLAPAAPLDRAVWSKVSSVQGTAFDSVDVNLPAAALGGSVALRWRLGSEGGRRSYATYSGWWIDDVACDLCTLDAPNDTIFADGFEGP